MEALLGALVIMAGLAFAGFFLWFCGCDVRLPVGWDKKWPPISDDEFMERCEPGTSRDVALRVRRVVSEQLGIPYEQVYPEQNFVRDLFCG